MRFILKQIIVICLSGLYCNSHREMLWRIDCANLLYEAGSVVQFHLRYGDPLMHQDTFQAFHLISISASCLGLAIMQASIFKGLYLV